MRVEQMITHSSLFKMKNKVSPTCLQGKCRDSLGEFSNTSYDVLRLRELKTSPKLDAVAKCLKKSVVHINRSFSKLLIVLGNSKFLSCGRILWTGTHFPLNYSFSKNSSCWIKLNQFFTTMVTKILHPNLTITLALQIKRSIWCCLVAFNLGFSHLIVITVSSIVILIGGLRVVSSFPPGARSLISRRSILDDLQEEKRRLPAVY